MKYMLAILFIAALVVGQISKSPEAGIKHPRLGFTQTQEDALVDTDMFDEQKYIEESGSDSSGVKTKRSAHEMTLTHEFMDGFNQVKECDGIVLLGAGTQPSDFTVKIMVDSHDTPGQKPVWVWILRNTSTKKLVPADSENSAKEAARAVCGAVWKQADTDHTKKASP
ncbi:MAG TPA: hypothetical protein VI636_15585 [Candidatus Angelobacter sp.]